MRTEVGGDTAMRITMSKNTRSVLVGIGIFVVIILGLGVLYTVRRAEPPTPTPTPEASPITPEVFQVSPDACELSFTIPTLPLIPGLSCVDKRLFRDDPNNTPGNYDLAGNELPKGRELILGNRYVYVINYKNSGTGAVGGKIVDTLPDGISFVDASAKCTNASGVVTCLLDTIDANGVGYVAIRIKVDSNTKAETFKNVARMVPNKGDESVCRLTNPIQVIETPVCNEACNDTNLLCETGLVCYKQPGQTTGVCRNNQCLEEEDCLCSSATPSPSPSTSASPSPSPSVPGSANPSPSPSEGQSAELDCVVKRAYEDDERNTQGQYYLNTEITDANTLSNGQFIVYNIVVANNGGAAVSDTTITDVLSNNLEYVDADNDCSYNANVKTVTCTVGSLPSNTQVSRSIRVKIVVAGASSINNTADIFSTNGQRDACSISVNATGQVVQPPSPIPTELPEAGVFEITVGTLGAGFLLLLLGALGLLLL